MSNNTIADKLQDLITAKQDMKDALEEKGVEVTGGLSTYADAVREIVQITDDYTKIKFGYNTDRISFPEWDTSEYTDLSWMYLGCMSLINAPELNTSKAETARGMFYDCQQLSYVPLYDFGNVKDVTSMFGWSSLRNKVTYEGFKDLGKQADLIGTEKMFSADATISSPTRPNVTLQSRINVINNLYNRASAGYSILSINIGKWSINSGNGPVDPIPDDIIAIATNKGWIITYDN